MKKIHILFEIIQPEKNSIDYLNQINEFYNSAWDKLIIGGGILITFIGIIVPILLQYWQLQTLKHREKLLFNEIESRINQSKSELKSLIEEIVEKENKKTKDEIVLILESTEGKILQTQGNFFYSSNISTALHSYFRSIKKYLNANEYSLIRRVLPMMNNCINKLSKKQIEELEENENINFHEFISELLQSEAGKVCENEIKTIRKSLKDKIENKHPQ